jgi:hypothetical protein
MAPPTTESTQNQGNLGSLGMLRRLRVADVSNRTHPTRDNASLRHHWRRLIAAGVVRACLVLARDVAKSTRMAKRILEAGDLASSERNKEHTWLKKKMPVPFNPPHCPSLRDKGLSILLRCLLWLFLSNYYKESLLPILSRKLFDVFVSL